MQLYREYGGELDDWTEVDLHSFLLHWFFFLFFLLLFQKNKNIHLCFEREREKQRGMIDQVWQDLDRLGFAVEGESGGGGNNNTNNRLQDSYNNHGGSIFTFLFVITF
jgi:hypothetical protein